MQDQSIVTVPVLSNVSSFAGVTCVSRCGPLAASVTSALQQALITANNSTLPVSSTTVCTEVSEMQAAVKSETIISQSNSADVRIAPSITAVSPTSMTDCMLTHDSLSVVSPCNDVHPESMPSRCSAYISTAGPTASRSLLNLEQLSSVFIENSSLHGHAVISHSKLKDSICTTKTVNCLNGGLSASSGDSDMELRPDILEGLSSVETDAGFSSLHSSPCSSELANVLDSTKETLTSLASNTEVVNCIMPVDYRHSHDAVPLNARLTHDSCLCEEGLSLRCDSTAEDSHIKAVSLASDIPAASVDDRVYNLSLIHI